MSSKSKKTPSKSSDDKPSKAPKLPESYILRPQVQGLENIAKITLNADVFSQLGLGKSSWLMVRKSEGAFSGVLLQAQKDTTSSGIEQNVVLMLEEARKLAGMLLGDRVQYSVCNQQPGYALTIGVNTSADVSVIKKALEDIGVVSVGLTFHVHDTTATIVGINDDISDEMGKLSLKDLSPTVLPTFIFHPAKTTVEIRDTPLDYLKYPDLSRPLGYNQVGGLDQAILALKTTVEGPLRNPEMYADFGISPPRGVLLHGPPGTGKTMLLRCVAQETPGVHVLTVDGPLVVSKYLGETEAAIRDIFIEARKFQPACIFIDEIDSLAPSRNSDDSGEVESRVVATLLTMMNGVGDLGRVVVVGATNRPNSIDPALRRPGRFDQEVEVGIPDAGARYDILTKQLRQKMNPDRQILTDSDIELVALKTHGYVGADLTALCRELVMHTINNGKQKVDLEDMLAAMTEIRPSAMREIFLEMPKVYWSDIGGQQELKRKLTEVVQLPLEAALAFARLGILAPKGVLLYGPPGCSKTLAAKALATESGLNFLAVKGPEILNKYVGESERAIREIFHKARTASPLIIFFDEIDAIAGDRELALTLTGLHVLTSLLNEIDGVEELKGVVIVAATNRPTEIDLALLRPGRLDRHIYVSPPDFDARKQIITNGTKKFNLENIDIDEYADKTDGCLGAEVALLCQEAGLAAIMENQDAITVSKHHFDKAIAGISKGITPDMLEYYDDFANRGGLNL